MEELNPTEPTPPVLQSAHGKQRWTTTWYFTSPSGERKRGFHSLGWASEIDKRQALARWQAWKLEREQARLGQSAQEPIRIGQIGFRYYRHALRTYRKDGRVTSHAWNVKCAMRDLRAFGGLEGDQMNAPRLASIRDRLAREGLYASTINERLRLIRKAFDWARERGWTRAGIAEDLRSVAGAKGGRGGAKKSGKVRPVDEKLARRVAESLPPPLKAMIEVLLLNGWRPEEVCSMRGCEIKRAGELWEYTPSHKLEHMDLEAVRLIGKKTQALLEPFLNRSPEAFLFSPKEAIKHRMSLREGHRRADQKPDKRRTGRVVGDCYTTETFRRAIHRACAALGLPKWNPNQLRHLRATSLREKFGLEATSAFLGHLNLSTTEIYADRSLALAARIAREEG